MQYPITYLNTALDFNNLLHALVSYERERLTRTIETDARKQDHLRADRSSVTAHLDEISATNHALGMHFEAFEGDDQDNPYLNLTPTALRYAIGSMAMLRMSAQAEADRALWWAQHGQMDADGVAQMHTVQSAMMGWDTYLFGKAHEISEACLALGEPEIDA